MCGENSLERWESPACGHQNCATCDLILLALEDVNNVTEARRSRGTRCCECVCDEGFGFGDLEVSGRVVGLTCAMVGCAGDGHSVAFDDLDRACVVGNRDECSPAGVNANSDGGATHRWS